MVLDLCSPDSDQMTKKKKKKKEKKKEKKKAILWIDDSYFSRKQLFKVKNTLMKDLFFTNTHLFISQTINWWTGVVWFFINCLDSHVDGTHSLQRIHCWAKSPNLFWWRNKLIYILNGLIVSKYSANFHFGVNYSFNLRLKKMLSSTR